MPLNIVKTDITLMHTDAIVNATDEYYSAGGGEDRSIHHAAGEELRRFLADMPQIHAGQCTVTPAYRLPAKYIIHTVAPRWGTEQGREEVVLHRCYREALRLAREAGCGSISLPLLGAGSFGCPEEIVYRIACEESRRFLQSDDMDIFIIVYTESARRIASKTFGDILDFIPAQTEKPCEARGKLPVRSPGRSKRVFSSDKRNRTLETEELCDCFSLREETCLQTEAEVPEDAWLRIEAEECITEAARPRPIHSLEEKQVKTKPFEDWESELRRRIAEKSDIGFSQTLLRKIDERGMKDAECYRRANLDRKLFSKIRNDPAYRPTKKTVLAFAVALRMTLEETDELLRTAGFARSGNSKMDIIVAYFIERGEHDIDKINLALYRYDQELLGAAM